ncbi:T9SS type A sorting domain-containing protein [Brumimicrobium glaciale]|uniref:T9SS type A sorting domain-containing protein n=1 Tax=Brumimicrobium glaciale TaxID=200475 RepID=A0A4Q4KJ46_9FLAO|nr:T9SS type A sorting domain-containing protein [Brumimicrobium glaciale]RYM33353.1 T9SS type A sorting domain-containing protein [Brumimicrobium glaciale]
MKKIYLLGAALIAFFTVEAQDCTGGRYDAEMFSNLDITSDIQYGSNVNFDGSNQDLLLDIYRPTGDTETDRPLIIFIHGGTFVAGSKTGLDVTPLAEMYAKKGYVTSSINYRLGMKDLFTISGPGESGASEAVMRATQDARAAVRFFKKSVAIDSNPYGIDTTNIYLVGSSAGGFVALHLSYLDQTSEIPASINQSDPSLTGGLEGNSGNPGYTSDVKAIVSISGAIGSASWMSNNTTPVLSLHGDNDNTVPFGTDMISVAIFDLLVVDGSESVHIKAEELGIKNCFKAHYGADHVPHVASAAYLDTTEQYITQFLLSEVCGEAVYCICNTPADPITCHLYEGTTGIEIEDLEERLLMYPNPAQNEVAISIEDFNIESIIIVDVNGRTVQNQMVNGSNANINVSKLNQGVYFVKVETEKGMLNRKLIVR